MYTLGIDFSHHQDDLKYDFCKLRDEGVRFVIAKLSEGTSWVDSTAVRKLETARKFGMITGVFHWVTPQHSPQLQADWFLRNSPDELVDFYVADIEDNTYPVHFSSFRDKKTRKQMAKKANKYGNIEVVMSKDVVSSTGKQFCDKLKEKQSKPVVIYTSKSFVLGKAAPMQSWMFSYPLWYAHYTNKYMYAENRTFAEIAKGVRPISWKVFRDQHIPAHDMYLEALIRDGQKPWHFWQFSGDRVRLSGTPAVTEYDIFNGSEDALVKFISSVEVK